MPCRFICLEINFSTRFVQEGKIAMACCLFIYYNNETAACYQNLYQFSFLNENLQVFMENIALQLSKSFEVKLHIFMFVHGLLAVV